MTADRRVAIVVSRRGRVEQFELAFETLRIGSASHCDIRLGPDEAAPEQLTLSPRDNGLWVRALSNEPRTLLNGQPFDQSLIEARARLELGAVVLTIELLDARPSGRDASSARKTVRQLAMLAGIAVLYALVLYEGPAESALARQVSPPPLFPDVAPAPCRQDEAHAARVFAREQLAGADSKRERSPFSMRDGVLAVPMYESAAACFELAGDHDAARTTRETAQKLAQKLEEELRAHQLRLDWFLSRRRYGAAVDEVRVLRELLAERDDHYGSWLSAVAHELQTMQTMRQEEK